MFGNMDSSTTQTAMYEPAHVLSKKSVRQHRNVFIWCTESNKLALGVLFDVQSSLLSPNRRPGWHVGNDSPITISTAYRWITSAVEAQYHSWKEAKSFTLFPVDVRPSVVMTYSVRKNGASLSRESQDIIAPGDYGLYTIGANTNSYTTMG